MIDLLVRVFQTDYPDPKCKLLALAVARRCGNERGICWAAQKTLCKDTGLSKSSLQRALAAMVMNRAGGAPAPMMRQFKRPKKGGRHQSDILTLVFPSQVLDAVDPELDAAAIEMGQASFWDLAEWTDEELEATGRQNEDEEADATGRQNEDGGSPGVNLKPGPGVNLKPGPGVNLKPKETLEETKQETNGTPEPAWPVSEVGVLDTDACLVWFLSKCSARMVARTSPDLAMDQISRLAGLKSKSLHFGDWVAIVSRAIEDYAGSEPATKEDCRYASGLQRLLEREAFRTEMMPAAARKVEGLRAGRPDPVDRLAPDYQRDMVRSWKSKGFWPESQGPAPDHFACSVPRGILLELGIDDAVREPQERRAWLQWYNRGRWSHTWGPEPDQPGCLISEAVRKALTEEALAGEPGGEIEESAADDAVAGVEAQDAEGAIDLDAFLA